MSIVGNLFTPRQKVLIKSVQHFFYRLFYGLDKIRSSYEYVIIKQNFSDIFFGYYDISPFNSIDEILYVKKKRNSNEIEICLNDSNDLSKEIIIATSKAWNWQQGCRLRWFPGSNDFIMFNFFESGRYGTRIINKNGDLIKNLNYPLYDISNDGNIGLSLNFERLGVLRPGYGYTCQSYIPIDLPNESINIINISTDTIIDRLTYSSIANFVSASCNLNNCYVNHLSFSPNSNSFLFFWIEIINGYHKASLLVYDIFKKQIIPLEIEEKVSHYVWLDNDNILCTSYKNPTTCRYFTYNLTKKSKTPYCPHSLYMDGHPSVDEDSYLLTDTYPDKNGFQYVYMVDSKSDIKKSLFKVYMKPVANGEMRTDLHPRFNHDHTKICIDSNRNGYREIMILKK